MKVNISFTIDRPNNASEAQIREWINYSLGWYVEIDGANPLAWRDIEAIESPVIESPVIKPATKKTVVYEALYCNCIHESAYSTISVHRTEGGAERAIARHKREKYDEWFDRYKGKPEQMMEFPFGEDESWAVGKIILED